MFYIDYNNFHLPTVNEIEKTVFDQNNARQISEYAQTVIVLNEHELVGRQNAANSMEGINHPDIGENIVIDENHNNRVYAVGLCALKNHRGILENDEITAFQNAYQELMVRKLIESSALETEVQPFTEVGELPNSRVEEQPMAQSVSESKESHFFKKEALKTLSGIVGRKRPNKDITAGYIYDWVENAKNLDTSNDAVIKKAVEDLESVLTCPISQEIFEDPVICSDHHSYESACIHQWLADNDTSPQTREKLTGNAEENTIIKQTVEWFNKRKG